LILFRRTTWTRAFLLALGLAAAFAPAELLPDRSADLILIDSLWIGGQRDTTLALIDGFLAEARADADSSFELELLVRQGARRSFYGRHREAEADLREAVALAEALRDSFALRRTTRWLGVALEYQGHGAAALACYERLLALSMSSGDAAHEGWARVGLAWNQQQGGSFDQASDQYRRAVERFRSSGELEGEIWARNGLGTVLNRQARFDEAAECYSETVTRAREIGHPMVEAMALNNLGGLRYSLGQPDLALKDFERARRLHGEAGNRREEIIPSLNIAYCQLALGQVDDARATLLDAIERSRAAGHRDLESKALRRLANLCWRTGADHAAAAYYREVLRQDEALSVDDWTDCRHGLALALARLDSLEAAVEILQETWRRAEARATLSILLRMRAELARDLSRLGRHQEAREQFMEVDRAVSGAGLADLRMSVLSDWARDLEATGDGTEALALYQEAAGVWETERGLPLDPQWREERGAGGRVLFTNLAYALLDASGGEPAPAFDRLQSYKSRTLMERMQGPGGGADEGAVGLATLDGLRRETLREGELLLDFTLGPERSILFALRRDGARAVELPDEDAIAERLQRYRQLLRNPDSSPESIEAAGRALREDWFAALGDWLEECRRLILCPDGALNGVPLEMILSEDSRPCDRVPSASILAHLRRGERRGTAGPARLLAFAREGDGEEVLPGALGEVRRLRRHFAGVESRRPGPDDAAPDSALLAGYDILHFATHARVDDQHPWQSEIQLCERGDRRNLRARQIAEMHLGSCLAVLASCETASGRVLSGEGVLGLSSDSWDRVYTDEVASIFIKHQ